MLIVSFTIVAANIVAFITQSSDDEEEEDEEDDDDICVVCDRILKGRNRM